MRILTINQIFQFHAQSCLSLLVNIKIHRKGKSWIPVLTQPAEMLFI